MPQPFHSVRVVGVQERGLSPVSSCLCAAPQAEVNLAPPCEQGGEVVGPSPPPPPPPPVQFHGPGGDRLRLPELLAVGQPPPRHLRPPGRRNPRAIPVPTSPKPR